MKTKNKIPLITSISAMLSVFVTLLVAYIYWTSPSIKIYQKERIGINKIVLYEKDFGAGGSKTINLTIGIFPNLRISGNIYSALLTEDSKNYFSINSSNAIDFYENDFSDAVFKREFHYKKIKINYHKKIQ